MAGQRYRLKATKTGLYALVRRHYGVPVKRQQTEFIRYPKSRDYGLDFYFDGQLYHFFLAACGGKVILSRQITSLGEDGPKTWDTADISLAELRELDLVETVPARKT